MIMPKQHMGVPQWLRSKESICNSGAAKDPGSILGSGRSLEEGMATHSSILAWRIPWTEESGRLQSIELQRIAHDGSNLACRHASSTWVLPWWRSGKESACQCKQATQVQFLVRELRSRMPRSNQAYMLLLLKHP